MDRQKYAAILAILLLFVSPVMGRLLFIDNFDQNFSNIQNPPPWTFGQLDSTNYFSPSFDSGGYVGRTISTSYAASPPNVYLLGYTGANVSANYGGIFAYLNASASYVVVNVYAYCQDPITASMYYYFLLINDGNSTYYSATNATLADADSSYGTYVLLSTALSVTPNSVITVMMGVENLAGSDATSRNFFFDNITISGANFDLWGAANLRLVDFDTGSLFSISSYANSRVIVTYAAGAPNVTIAVTSPTLTLNLAGATLITVWVGQSYERSIIPDPYAVNIVYLDNPNDTLPYLFSVVDLTQHFGVGSRIYLSYSGQAQDFIMTSGYTDAASTFSTYLQPGTYQAQIINLTNSYTETVTLGGASSSVTIAITKVPITSPGSATSSITYGTGWSGTNLVTQFNDLTGSATAVTWTLYQQTYLGTGSVASYTDTGTWGSWTYSYDVTGIGLNTTNAPQLLVSVEITDIFGDHVYGPFPVTVPRGTIFSSNPSFPSSILGMDAVLPQSDAWLNFGAAIVLLVVAATFTSRASPFGILAVSVFAAFFGYAGWLPIDETLISIIVPIAVMGILVAKQRGTGH
jgi:hypothetical protein